MRKSEELSGFSIRGSPLGMKYSACKVPRQIVGAVGVEMHINALKGSVLGGDAIAVDIDAGDRAHDIEIVGNLRVDAP